MGNKENYDQSIDTIAAIPPEETLEPNMPVETAAQEAENLFDWATRDMEELLKCGLDRSLVESLPVRAGALRKAESNWFTGRFAKAEASRAWEKDSPAAYDLRDRLIHDMLFAYRRFPDLLARVQAIAEGAGHSDMIQDLSDLAELGNKNPDPLKAIATIDFAGIAKAEKLSGDMARLLAGAKATAGATAAKIIRDQAFTYLKQAVDEVRAVGQFVFWKRKDRLIGYGSQYHRQKNTGKSTSNRESAEKSE